MLTPRDPLDHSLQEAFVLELEEINETYREEELSIEGEYASEETMVGWGWGELLCLQLFDSLSIGALVSTQPTSQPSFVALAVLGSAWRL